MLTSIVIKGFRGVKEGSLEGLKKINVLVGRNNTGKSTILEAAYLALSVSGDAYARVVKRRGWYGVATLEQLFYNGGGSCEIALGLGRGIRAVKLRRGIPIGQHVQGLRDIGLDVKNVGLIEVEVGGKEVAKSYFYIDEEGRFEMFFEGEPKEPPLDAVLVDWELARKYGSPEEAYSRMLKMGGVEAKRQLIRVLSSKIRGIKDVEPLNVYGKWVLHVVQEEAAIPVYSMGDGVKQALSHLMPLLSLKNTLILLEEPELHQHPGLLELVVNAIVTSCLERDNQALISTHSLELVDELLRVVGEKEVGDKVALYRLSLTNGVLRAVSYELEEAQKLRKELEYDLRG